MPGAPTRCSPPALVVGRAPASGLVLHDEALVAGPRASSGVDASGVVVEDLGSTNGVVVDGARSTGRRPWTPRPSSWSGTSTLRLRRPPARVRRSAAGRRREIVAPPAAARRHRKRSSRSPVPQRLPSATAPACRGSRRSCPVPVGVGLALFLGPQLLALRAARPGHAPRIARSATDGVRVGPPAATSLPTRRPSTPARDAARRGAGRRAVAPRPRPPRPAGGARDGRSTGCRASGSATTAWSCGWGSARPDAGRLGRGRDPQPPLGCRDAGHRRAPRMSSASASWGRRRRDERRAALRSWASCAPLTRRRGSPWPSPRRPAAWSWSRWLPHPVDLAGHHGCRRPGGRRGVVPPGPGARRASARHRPARRRGVRGAGGGLARRRRRPGTGPPCPVAAASVLVTGAEPAAPGLESGSGAAGARGAGPRRGVVVRPRWLEPWRRCAAPGPRGLADRAPGAVGHARTSLGCRDRPEAGGRGAGEGGEPWRAVAALAAPAAVVGSGPHGIHSIDLSRDGPHVLVGGTTGSGKSEFLRTLVVSLAISSPAERPDPGARRLQGRRGVRPLRGPPPRRRAGHRPRRPPRRPAP